MEVRFDKECYLKRWVFPIAISWEKDLLMYLLPTFRLMVEFLCFRVAITFFKKKVK